MLQLPCVYFPHAPQISGLLPRLPITFLLPAPPRSLQPFLPVPPTLGLLFLENAHLGSPADSPVSGCPHLSQRVLTCLGVSSHVLGCPHPSRHVLTCLGVSSPVSGYPHLSQRVLICLGVSSHILGCPHLSQGVLTRLGMWCPHLSRHVVSLPFSGCPHPSWHVLTHLGVSSPVLAYPLLLLSSAGMLSTCPQRRQGVPRGSTKRQMCNDPFFLPKQPLEVSSETNILRHKSRFC